MDVNPLRFSFRTGSTSADATRPVKSVTLTGHGSIAKIKVSKIPLEASIPDEHVEVQVYYCGLNFTDNYLRLGIIRSRNFPIIMGSECSGVIKRVADNVTDLQVGQKVLCLQMQGGLFRQYVHVHRKYCFPLPKYISLKDAVGLGLNFLVAYLCLYEFGWLAKSERVFMQSIAGGVGTALVQLAKTVEDVEIIGTASESKHEKLKSLGVNRIFSHKENYETGILQDYPEGVDIVVNTNGGSEIDKCIQILHPVGRLVLLGSNSTVTYPKSTSWGIIRPEWDSGTMSSAGMISRSHCVTGVNIATWADLYPDAVQSTLNIIFKLYSNGRIEPCIHDVLPLSQVAEGITQLCCRENFGKVILEVKDESANSPVAEIPTSTDQHPEAVEKPKVKADPDVQKGDGSYTAETKVGEDHNHEEPEQNGAEDKIPAHAP